MGSDNNEEIDKRTFSIVKAGVQSSLKIFNEIEPLELILGWKILVVKEHLGGLKR